MRANPLSIGALAARTGCPTPTIRYYEEIGILPNADRQPNGRRSYGAEDVQRLAFVKRCRDFGFTLDEVRVLLTLQQAPERPCDAALELVEGHLAAVQVKIQDLLKLEQDLRRFIQKSVTDCAVQASPDCAILRNMTVAPENPA